LLRQIPQIEHLLRRHRLLPRIVATTRAPDSARQLALASRDSRLVLACGGDGTVHGVVQGLAHTGVPLGIVPLGTANALARYLRLPLDPLAAVRTLVEWRPSTLPLGEIRTQHAMRLFVLMAGCGPDGALIHSLPPAAKARLGRGAYYAHAARLFFTRRWPAFAARYRRNGETAWHETWAVAAMAARVPDLGGAFSGLTRGAWLSSLSLRVQLLAPPARVSFAAWFACSRLRLPNPWLKTLEVAELECSPIEPASGPPVYTQADAEPLGPLPMRLRVIPDALRLLLPAPGISPAGNASKWIAAGQGLPVTS
jgi:diacylglycerol kinase family enzyme